jgi:hypothetical protein
MMYKLSEQGADMARATGKQAIRLWFEFLKRALASPEVKVKAKHYQAWGDVQNTTFDAWWKAHGAELFPQHKVQLVQRRLSDAGVVHVAVPMNLTPTTAANQVRELLIHHYQAIDHTPKAQRVYEFTLGAEIKVSALRSYLATYDAHVKLAGELGKQTVPAKLVLAEVRRVYMAKTHRWSHTKRNVEGLPSALADQVEYDSRTGEVVASGDDTGAERAVRRYLRIAHNLVKAAAGGDFPSADYNKV